MRGSGGEFGLLLLPGFLSLLERNEWRGKGKGIRWNEVGASSW